MTQTQTHPPTTAPAPAALLADAAASVPPVAFDRAEYQRLSWWCANYQIERKLEDLDAHDDAHRFADEVADPAHRFVRHIVFLLWLRATGRLTEDPQP